MLKRLEESLQENDRIFLALSGGADSTALFCLLVELLDNAAERLSCLHLDHGLRTGEEARKEEAFVQELCARHGIALRVEHIVPGSLLEQAKKSGDSIEALARAARHDFFQRQRNLALGPKNIEAQEEMGQRPESGEVWLALAHNADDVYESLLMRILRGSGPRGLSPLKASDRPLLRPLIDVSRAEIEAWLRQRGQIWCEDPSNRQDIYLRNKVRHQLIPLLNEHFPFWPGGLEGLAKTQEEIKNDIESRLLALPAWERQAFGAKLSFPRKVFFEQSSLMQEEIILNGIGQLIGEAGEHIPRSGPDLLAPRLPRRPRRQSIRNFLAAIALSPSIGREKILNLPGLSLFIDKTSLFLTAESQKKISQALIIRHCGYYRIGALSFSLYIDGDRRGDEGAWPVALPVGIRFSSHCAKKKRQILALLVDSTGRMYEFIGESNSMSIRPRKGGAMAQASVNRSQKNTYLQLG